MSAGGAEPSDALDWARNSVQATSSVKFAGDDDVDAFGFEEVRHARTSPMEFCILAFSSAIIIINACL